jgi:hypothetical protein
MTMTPNSNWIRVSCHTNIDKFRCEDWPTNLPAVPNIGHCIRAKSGVTLCIVALTWTYMGELDVELGTLF